MIGNYLVFYQFVREHRKTCTGSSKGWTCNFNTLFFTYFKLPVTRIWTNLTTVVIYNSLISIKNFWNFKYYLKSLGFQINSLKAPIIKTFQIRIWFPKRYKVDCFTLNPNSTICFLPLLPFNKQISVFNIAKQLAMSRIQTHNFSGDRHWLYR